MAKKNTDKTPKPKPSKPNAAKPAPSTPAPAAASTAPRPKAERMKMPPLPKMPHAKRTAKPKPMVACKCGCGGMTTGMWVPGHDARARGWAIRIEREVCKMSDVPENEREGAKYFLKVRKETGAADSSKLKVVKGGKDKAPTPKADAPAADTTAATGTAAGFGEFEEQPATDAAVSE